MRSGRPTSQHLRLACQLLVGATLLPACLGAASAEQAAIPTTSRARPATTQPGAEETPAPPTTTPTAAPASPTPAPGQLRSLSGWFTIVWNDQPHYSITDDQGEIIQLQLDEELMRPLGGPLALDRRRVTIIGELLSVTPKILQVRSIELEGQ